MPFAARLCRVAASEPGRLNMAESQPSPVPPRGSVCASTRAAPGGASPSAQSIRFRRAAGSSPALNVATG